MAFRPLINGDDFDAALTQAATRPLVIFKHSTTCGISMQAYEEVDRFLEGTPSTADVYLVDVHASRAVSNEIAARLHIRHASPQVLLIRDGTVRWHASHFRVTAEAMRAALQPVALAPAEPDTGRMSLRRVSDGWLSH